MRKPRRSIPESLPLAKFRVYPNERIAKKRGHYFTVVVFRTLREMRAHAKHENGAKFDTSDMWAVVQGWTRRTYIKGQNSGFIRELGEILFCQKHVSVRIVSHECVHAMMLWARQIGLDRKWLQHNGPNKQGLCGDFEERMAYAVGDMTAKIYRELYAQNLIYGD